MELQLDQTILIGEKKNKKKNKNKMDSILKAIIDPFEKINKLQLDG